MGGLGGEVRGATQEKPWKTFKSQIRSQFEERYGFFLDAPLTREAAFKNMRRDEKSGSRILDYHFPK